MISVLTVVMTIKKNIQDHWIYLFMETLDLFAFQRPHLSLLTNTSAQRRRIVY